MNQHDADIAAEHSGTLDSAGLLHHVEINVSNLDRSRLFWGWFLERLGYTKFQEWDAGTSWRLGATYIVFVQTVGEHLEPAYHRSRTGLNHLAFHAASRAQIDDLVRELDARAIPILYRDRHPHAGGGDSYVVFFEDPDRIKVELAAPW
jgi:catechol 2,3-dioxygenase-like lactoylglutathione lyase family enzyme